jgi:hypothetical protein
MTKRDMTYENVVARGTLFDAIHEFKKSGEPTLQEAVDEFIRSGGTREEWLAGCAAVFDQLKVEHAASKPLSVLIDQRRKS